MGSTLIKGTSEGQQKQLDQLEEIAQRTASTAKGQESQLIQLTEIGHETASTASALRTETAIEKVVAKFFSTAGEEAPNRYNCVFPVSYGDRPLPAIFAGDWSTLQVLQSLMGARLQLKPLQREAAEDSHEFQELLKGNAVYLCAPQANNALQLLAPALKCNDPSSLAATCDGIELPAWFATEKGGTKTIRIRGPAKPIESGAEPEYERAKRHSIGSQYEPSRETTTDYGIVLRLTLSSRKVVVIAGIHQYGTWIGGDFFRRLAAGESLDYQERFLDDHDFLAIVYGEFDPIAFKVVRCNVSNAYLWTRDDTCWNRVEGPEEQS